jgi:hypothetical protein
MSTSSEVSEQKERWSLRGVKHTKEEGAYFGHIKPFKKMKNFHQPII